MFFSIVSNSDFAALGDMNLLTFPWLLFRAGGIKCIVQTKGNKLKAEFFLCPKFEFSCICIVSSLVNILFSVSGEKRGGDF